MKVRFKVAWGPYSVGQVITPNGTLRSWLLANGFVEVCTDKARTPKRPPVPRVKA